MPRFGATPEFAPSCWVASPTGSVHSHFNREPVRGEVQTGAPYSSSYALSNPPSIAALPGATEGPFALLGAE